MRKQLQNLVLTIAAFFLMICFQQRTAKGLNIYFDFPHVMAVFDKAFVPYSVVKRFLKSTGPAARVAQMSDKLF